MEPTGGSNRPTKHMTSVGLTPTRKGRGASTAGIVATVSVAVLLAACGKPGAESIGATSAPTTTLVTTSTTPTTRASSSPTTPSSALRPTTTARAASDPPTTRTTPVSSSGVQGSVRFGPVCPVERIPPDPQCAPRPGAASIQLLGPNGGVVAQGDAGGDGRFSISVGPGAYDVRAVAPSSGPGRGCQAEPARAKVVAGSFATVTVTCDTGIR